jgi:hypothetical protein
MTRLSALFVLSALLNEAFNCAGEEGICDEEGGDIFSRGDCGTVSDLIDALCPEDSGF